MRKMLGIVCYIGIVTFGFSINTAFGIIALILCWMVAWKMER
jgi:hypothetical protein